MHKLITLLSYRILNITLFVFVLCTFASCGALVQVSRTGQTLAPLTSDTEVKVFKKGGLSYFDAQRLGTIYIGDTGFTVGQTRDVALERVKAECRKLGGNAIEVIRVESPDSYSTSYRISAIAYRIYTKKIDPSIERTGYKKEFLTKYWAENGLDDHIEGIYERVVDGSSGAKYELAVKKIDNNTFYIIYLSGISYENTANWKEGDLKAICYRTATSNLYKVEWYMRDKTQYSGVYATFNNSQMKILIRGKETAYLKLYPCLDTESKGGLPSSPDKMWTGTGFAINNKGFIATNHHVINGANHIYIYGVGGDFNRGYSATVVASDERNDLAIIRIEDSAIQTIGTPPYNILFKTCEVGCDVVTLGFPLTTTMGDELKVTNGIISAKTGFKGDVTTYQVSAPVQPGNSGGPLIDSTGDIIGIISSKHKSTENVSYAIKSTYLHNLAMSYNIEIETQSHKTLNNLPLPTQVKMVRNFIYLIKCK